MAFISSPFILRVQNAAGFTVVPVTRTLKFVGGIVVTQVVAGQATIDGTLVSGNAWDFALGNAGAGGVLGTTTNDPWNFLQNNLSRGGFANGGAQFWKTHAAFTGSESYRATSAVQTTNAVATTIFTLPVTALFTGKLNASIMGRKTTGLERAVIEKTVMFYREGAGAVLGTQVQSDFTDKSQTAYDVTFLASGNNILVQVTGKAGETINWAGTFEWQAVSLNT